MAANIINYKPPPILREFIKDYRPGELFYDWVVGPVGSGKTTAIFFKLIYMAKLQAKGPDGIRRSRAVIVRNTMPQLKDTTLASWNTWFVDGVAGEWIATSSKFILRFGDVECEVLFRPLDTPDDVARVLSLELTFAIIDEFVQIPRVIVDALSGRLGRYPSAKDGGATNFGMWGSSNPDTEDNWWYGYLHDRKVCRRYRPSLGDDDADRMANWLTEEDQFGATLDRNATYFKQPSGLSKEAENLDHLLQTSETLALPLGDPKRIAQGRTYYSNITKGKSEAWVKQFVEAEWGYSISGQPVVPSFKPQRHIVKKLLFNPNLPLVIGLDPGIQGSACIFGQETLEGRLNVLGELVQVGYGADRLIRERVKPYIRHYFPDAHVIIAPDPAAANRTQTDEKTVVDRFRLAFGRENVKAETNNRFPLRLDAIEHFTTRLCPLGETLAIDEEMCPTLIRALKGGWRYAIDVKKAAVKGAIPEKNQYSHPGDAFGYLCRYFHRIQERDMRYTGVNGQKFVPPKSFGSPYHFR